MIRKKIAAQVSVCFMKEKESFVAYSPALDLSTCGRTLEEAKKNFLEALDIFFEDCTEMGTLDKVLESLGWEKKGRKQWLPPIPVHEETVSLPDLAFA